MPKKSKNKTKTSHHLDNNAQHYLDTLYSRKNEITTINIGSKNLEGKLSVDGFINLKELDCSNSHLTSLNITNCPKLRKIDCYYNDFTTLNISNQLELEELNCSGNNQLTILTLTNNPNLFELNYDNCPLTETRIEVPITK